MANVGVLVLALANGVISYDALAGAARDAGLPWLLSWLFPLATDGIIAVATPAQLLLRTREDSRWPRIQVGLMLWAAIAFSVVGNASRASQLWSGITVYGVPLPTWHAVWLALAPLAYAGALHILGLVHRDRSPGSKEAPGRRLIGPADAPTREANETVRRPRASTRKAGRLKAPSHVAKERLAAASEESVSPVAVSRPTAAVSPSHETPETAVSGAAVQPFVSPDETVRRMASHLASRADRETATVSSVSDATGISRATVGRRLAEARELLSQRPELAVVSSEAVQ